MNWEQKWLYNKKELLLYVALAAIGFLSSLLTYRLLDGYAFESGKNLAGVFVPPSLCIGYTAYTTYRCNTTKTLLYKTLLLFIFQILPFVPLFFQTFVPTPTDDFNRYYLYAKNMIEQHTLWGGDKLYFPNAGYYYVTQPGYRYFIALELLSFGGLYRFVQFINIGLLITATVCFQKAIKNFVADRSLQRCLLLLTVLLTPYATKNLLMGLSEWLTALLLMMSCYLYGQKRKLAFVLLLLSLIPFFRQNLLIAMVLLAGFIVISNPRKLRLALVFLVPLLLPLYHNLYYAGEWRFFVKLFTTPLLNDSKSTGLDLRVFLINLYRLFGFERVNGNMRFDLFAFTFLPFSTGLYFFLLRRFQKDRTRLLYVIITLAVILPGLYLGKDYYPRFEFVSVVAFITTYCMLKNHFRRHSLSTQTFKFL